MLKLADQYNSLLQHKIHVDKGEPDYKGAYDVFIKDFIDQGVTNLLVPIVKDDHWHLLEFDMLNNVAGHYDSLVDRSGHMGPVMNIVKAFNMFKAGFDENNLYSIFNPIPVPCELQKGSYDCGIYVYLYIKAIITGKSVLPLTPQEHNTWVIRSRLAAKIIIEGRKMKKELGVLDDDDIESSSLS